MLRSPAARAGSGADGKGYSSLKVVSGPFAGVTWTIGYPTVLLREGVAHVLPRIFCMCRARNCPGSQALDYVHSLKGSGRSASNLSLDVHLSARDPRCKPVARGYLIGFGR